MKFICPRCGKLKELYYTFYFFKKGKSIDLCSDCERLFKKHHDVFANKFMEIAKEKKCQITIL
jgi:hypothetical protein